MISFLNIDDIKLVMNEEQSQRFNTLRNEINNYSKDINITKLTGIVFGATAGGGVGYSGGKVLSSKLNDSIFSSTTYNNILGSGKSFTVNYDTVSKYSPLVGTLIGVGSGGYTGFQLAAHSPSVKLAEHKIFEAGEEMQKLIAEVIQNNEGANPDLIAKKALDGGVDLSSPLSLINLSKDLKIGNISIESTSMDYSSALALQNQTLNAAGIDINNVSSTSPTTTIEQPLADSETQSKWEAWLDEHPNIKTYITNVKNMDPFTISATVAGTLLVGWGLYKAAKAWNDYRTRKLQENNSEEDNIE